MYMLVKLEYFGGILSGSLRNIHSLVSYLRTARVKMFLVQSWFERAVEWLLTTSEFNCKACKMTLYLWHEILNKIKILSHI